MMKWAGALVSGFMLLWPGAAPVLGGDGMVALQTADPACPDNSGDIYVDCGNGTVTDNRTGLVWLKNADCYGPMEWHEATEIVANLSDLPPQRLGSPLADQDCGLGDKSSPGEWRLPTAAEWQRMVSDALGFVGDPDCTASPPTITNDSGSDCWVNGPSSFYGVTWLFRYWTSTTATDNHTLAWEVFLNVGHVGRGGKTNGNVVWPVRGGQ